MSNICSSKCRFKSRPVVDLLHMISSRSSVLRTLLTIWRVSFRSFFNLMKQKKSVNLHFHYLLKICFLYRSQWKGWHGGCSSEVKRSIWQQVCKELPVYARPLFIRHIPEAVLTGTFKNKKVDFAKEGFDLNKVNDPLYFIDNENKTYSPLTKFNLANFLSSKL